MKKILYIATIGFTLLTSSCNDFLDRQVPQGIVTGDQIASPEYVDNLVISAYAIWATGDDINSSFSLWNYDVRSDDCYKGGSGTEDGGVFNALEISKGITTLSVGVKTASTWPTRALAAVMISSLVLPVFST